ncbi:hypothetical protein ACA910_006774 [Epithemia clementina (nom. ined.)]
MMTTSPLPRDWLTVDKLEAFEHQCNVARLNPLPRPVAVAPFAPEGEEITGAVPNDPIVPIVLADPPFAAAPAPDQVEQDPQHPQLNEPPDDLDDGLVDLMDNNLLNNIWDAEEVVIVEEEEEEVENPEPRDVENPEPRDMDCATERKHRQEHLQQPDKMRLGRGRRERKPNPRYTEYLEERWATLSRFKRGSQHPKEKIKREVLNNAFLSGLDWKAIPTTIKTNNVQQIKQLMDLETDPTTGTVEEIHPMAFAIVANAADNPNWNEAINGPDAEGFAEACKKEIKMLQETMDAWDIV